jgi:hypothetical protein
MTRRRGKLTITATLAKRNAGRVYVEMEFD